MDYYKEIRGAKLTAESSLQKSSANIRFTKENGRHIYELSKSNVRAFGTEPLPIM